MKYKRYKEWKIQKQQQRQRPETFRAFTFIWKANGISAAGLITIIRKYANLMYGI